MKNKLLFIIFFYIFLTLIINAQTEEEIIKATSSEKYWKRHFFDLCLMGGPSIGTSLYYKSGGYFTVPIYIGGSIGASFGYQYAFTDKFAFGPGFSAFFNIIGNIYFEDIYYTTNNHSINAVTSSKYSFGEYNGAALLFSFMFGDLKNKKIAFLLDIGGGHTGTVKLGLYHKGFVFKTGYTFTFFSSYYGYTKTNYYIHNITFDFGYKFNWKNKFEGKILKK